MNKDITIGGKWNILNKEYQGDITYNEENGWIILSIYYKYNGEILTWTDKPTKIDIITGKLNQEIKCTLVDCHVVKRHCDAFIRHHIIIVAKSMFLNITKHKKNLLKFNEIHFHISNIVKWSQLSGFEYFDDENYILKMGYKSKDTISQKISDNTIIEFVPCFGGFNFDMQVEKLDISQHIEIHIKKTKEASFDEFLEDFKMISDMITLATGSKINVSQVRGINYKKYSGIIGDKKNYVKNEIITNLVKHDNTINLDAERINNYLFYLRDITTDDKLKKWFETYSNYYNVYNLYNLGINNEVPDEIRFCNLIQGLELLNTKEFKNVKKFFKHIDEKFKDNLPIIDLIKNNPDQNDKFVLLKNRLIDLFINDFDFSSSDIIIDNIDILTTIFSDTRHYYTHYDDAKKDKALKGDNLKYGIYILEYLLSNFILLNLNFSIEDINKRKEFQLNNIKNCKMIEKIIGQ